MIVDLTDEEIRVLRALLIYDSRSIEDLSEIMRQRIVLKLHAALEQILAGEAVGQDSVTRVQ